jgi:putative endonuclease
MGCQGQNGSYFKARSESPIQGAQVTWTVYIIETSNGSYYTGVTTDISKRWQDHAQGRGSRAVRMAGGPKKLVWSRPGLDKQTAHRLEGLIKRLSRSQKARVIAGELALANLENGPESGEEGLL